jgi:hypothetical protein
MTTSRIGEWTDEEVKQIGYIMRGDVQSHKGFATFLEDNDWELLFVQRRVGSRSAIEMSLSRTVDGKLLNFEFCADNSDVEWGDGPSWLTDQVFWLTIILMEYVGIFGIEDLDDGYEVKLIPRRSVYDFRPPDK